MKDHQGECTFKKEGRKMELVIIQYDVVFVVVVMFFNLKLAFNRHVRCWPSKLLDDQIYFKCLVFSTTVVVVVIVVVLILILSLLISISLLICVIVVVITRDKFVFHFWWMNIPAVFSSTIMVVEYIPTDLLMY